MEYVIGFVIGLCAGVGLALLLSRGRDKTLLAQLDAASGQMRDAFAAVASEALDANSRRLTETSAAALDGKKELIDQSIRAISDRLELVRQFVQKVESQRKEDLGSLSTAVTSLSSTAGELHKMLASTQRRGAWGERMAEDVLRLAGLQENLNYVKQSSADAINGRADFTFLLPNGLKANMDVKFPLEKYKAFLDGQTDAQRSTSLKELCMAVRGHIRTVAGRGYIDPKIPTVPYVIVFIPSEQIFSLVLECQPDLIDDAIALKVVLCSPLTLYAKLAIMRQAAESFNLVKTADEVISLLGSFHKQWQKYNEELDKLGQRIDSAVQQFATVRVTRTNMLQKPLDKIEELRTARGLPDGE